MTTKELTMLKYIFLISSIIFFGFCNTVNAASTTKTPNTSTTSSLADGFSVVCKGSTAPHCKESALHIYNNTDYDAVIGLTTGKFVRLPADTNLQQDYAVETTNYGTELRVIKKILLNVGNTHEDDSFIPCAYAHPNFPIKLAPGHIYEVDVKFDLIEKTCSIDVQKHIKFN